MSLCFHRKINIPKCVWCISPVRHSSPNERWHSQHKWRRATVEGCHILSAFLLLHCSLTEVTGRHTSSRWVVSSLPTGFIRPLSMPSSPAHLTFYTCSWPCRSTHFTLHTFCPPRSSLLPIPFPFHAHSLPSFLQSNLPPPPEVTSLTPNPTQLTLLPNLRRSRLTLPLSPNL